MHAAARDACARSIQLRAENLQLRQQRFPQTRDGHAAAALALARSARAYCAAANQKLRELQHRLTQTQTRLREMQDQQAILREQIETLTALLAERDAAVHAMLADIENLNAEIQTNHNLPRPHLPN